MIEPAQLDRVLAAVSAWARSRPEILSLALVGSWARGAARPDSDIDLLLVARDPQAFRGDEGWVANIRWPNGRPTDWHDADYGAAWSRHMRFERHSEIEFTFCAPSWAATRPVDPGTLQVVSMGCRVLLDKAGLLENLLVATSP